MKIASLTLACLLLLIPCMLLTASAESTFSIEWQQNSGFDLHSGINGEWTINAHPASNKTIYIEFYIDDKLKQNDTQAPYSWTFNTANYPEGLHSIKTVAHTSTGEFAAVTDERSFVGFPYMSIVGVLLFASIIFAFALLLTWHIIKKKAMARRIFTKISSATEPLSKR